MGIGFWNGSGDGDEDAFETHSLVAHSRLVAHSLCRAYTPSTHLPKKAHSPEYKALQTGKLQTRTPVSAD